MTWHASDSQLAEYASGSVDVATAASVEAHVTGCPICQRALARDADELRLMTVWAGIADRIDEPRIGIVERVLRRSGIAPSTARLLAATPSLRLSWLAALVAVLGFAVAAAQGEPDFVRAFLVLAPLLPVVGVAAAYGPAIDPTYEIGIAAPFSSTRLLLIRSSAVLVVTTLLSATGAALLPGLGWTSVAWLLPALGLTSTSLLIATRYDPVFAAGVVSSCWLALTYTGAEYTHRLVAQVGPRAQLSWLVVAVVSVNALIRTAGRFDEGGTR